MPREAAKYLFDIAEHLARLQRFVAGKTFEDYAADELLRAAVERQFEIIGEAINERVGRAVPDRYWRAKPALPPELGLFAVGYISSD